MRTGTRFLQGLLLSIVLLGTVVPAAFAQYFGRNKVKYRTFDFSILKTEHFDVYYYDEERTAAEIAARMAERWYTRLSKVLDHQLSSRQPLILYGSHPAFEQTSVIAGDIGEGTGGVTEALKRRIVLPLAPTLAETDHVIGHELTHAFQFDITTGAALASGTPAAVQMPLWFIEGMAEYLSLGPIDPNTTMWMRDAVRSNDIPMVSKLENPKYFPYRYGHALWSYIAGRFGERAVGASLVAAARIADPERAIASITGVGPDTLSRDWHAALRTWYASIAPRTEDPSSEARRVIAGSSTSRYNVSPALSPDGRWLVFLSEREQFSVEMYLADANSGQIVRRLTRAALDPHLQSLQFIQSAGSFSADGSKFAYGAIENGQSTLVIYDVAAHRETKKMKFREIEEIFHPTWSPDGTRIAFAGQTGGFTDLFVVDASNEKLTRLTQDAYAALEPAWSPDGRTIAYVTDAFTTKLDDLTYQGYGLATIPAEGGTLTRVPGFAGAKNINPQWTASGDGLYFISDPDGISNTYVVTLASGSLQQVTNIPTGVSGITALSPAISAARSASRLAMSVYEKGTFHVDLIDSPERLAGTAPHHAGAAPPPSTTASNAGEQTAPVAATLPPTDRNTAQATSVIERPGQTPLPSSSGFQRNDYRAKLSLDRVSSLSAGIGIGGGSVSGGGGVTLHWSDMLGDHNLTTLAQFSDVGGSFWNGVAAGVGYWNERGRWNWGGQVSQIPQLARSIVLEGTTVGGQPAIRQLDYREFQIQRDVLAQLAYPFTRAHRVEMSGGFRQIDFGGEVQELVFLQSTGEIVSDVTSSLAADTLPSLNLGLGSAALVYDNSYFGGTSPVLGRRYRFEVSPVVGDLQFIGALADFRQYFRLFRPFVLATRLYHAGRYGEDAENDALAALFVGYPWLVRGYDSESFTADECETGDCSEFDRLLGSRLAVGNVELRMPLIGPVGLLRTYVVPPIELAGFYDVGAAWRESEPSPFANNGRAPVSSHGVALRVNLFGLVLETNYVHPNDRPLKGWYWQVNLQPGF